MGPIAYVGATALNALKAHSIGWWNDSQGTQTNCIASFDALVQPHLGDLLFMSESDREFDLVSFPGQGAFSPTGDQVMSLTKAEAGSTAFIRPTDDYYVAFEPSSSTADATAAAKVQAAFGTLSDVTYIAVFKPTSDPYHAEVDVYLLGRTGVRRSRRPPHHRRRDLIRQCLGSAEAGAFVTASNAFVPLAPRCCESGNKTGVM